MVDSGLHTLMLESSRMTIDYRSKVIKNEIFIYLLLQNGGHQLLPTTDSPTISACTTSTNLSNLEFQSGSTLNQQIFYENNLRRAVPELEPLQPKKYNMTINATKQEVECTDEENQSTNKTINRTALLRQVSLNFNNCCFFLNKQLNL